MLFAGSAFSQAPASSTAGFAQDWLIVSEVTGDAPLFTNERTQLKQAVYGWAQSQGARLMPVDTYDRLPANRCAASAIEKAPLEAIYPQVGELDIHASCGADACALNISLRIASERKTNGWPAARRWTASVAAQSAHEVSSWLGAVHALAPPQQQNRGMLVATGGRFEEPNGLRLRGTASYGVEKPLYEEDFKPLEQALQRCFAVKANGSGSHESILFATVRDAEVSGCEADVDTSLDRTGHRAKCFCDVARSIRLPEALQSTGRARVRIDLFNGGSAGGPKIELLDERSSANFLRGINSSFDHLLGKVQMCFSVHSVALPDERQLRVQVSDSGHLQSAHLTGGGANPQLTQCLQQALRTAAFPCTTDNQPATFEATVRTSARAIDTAEPKPEARTN